jgi:hypothetical protein
MKPFLDWGIEVVVWFQQFGPTLDLPFKSLTFLGNLEFFLVLMPFIYWCVDRRLGARLLVLFLISAYVNAMAKVVADQPRPFQYDARVQPLVHAGGGGMPSGHTQGAVVVWGYLASQIRSGKIWIIAGFLMIAIPIWGCPIAGPLSSVRAKGGDLAGCKRLHLANCNGSHPAEPAVFIQPPGVTTRLERLRRLNGVFGGNCPGATLDPILLRWKLFQTGHAFRRGPERSFGYLAGAQIRLFRTGAVIPVSGISICFRGPMGCTGRPLALCAIETGQNRLNHN